MSFKYIDLSHDIEHGLNTYKGLPAPIVCDYLSRQESKAVYEDDSEFQISKIEMVANTGTYLDCPFHRFQDGNDLSKLRIEELADLECVVIRVNHNQRLAITEKDFETVNIQNKAVLIQTDWSEYWNTELYYENHPFLTEAAALYLKEKSVKLVGIDSHNIDDTRLYKRPVHTILLGADILIVEHLCNLIMLPDNGFLFNAVPPKFKGVGSFPVRAYGKIKA